VTQVDRIERDFRRVINSHSHGLDDVKEVVAGLDRTTGAVGEGLNLAISRIDADLEELNKQVNRRRRECKTNEAVLDLYKARLEELEKLFDLQSVKLAEMESRLDSVACRCGSTDKGKGREVVEVEESIPDVLGSPIQISSSSANVGSLSSSYLVPPVANESSSMGAMESLVSALVLVKDDDKENQQQPRIGVIAAYRRFEALQSGSTEAREFVRDVRTVLEEH